MGYRPTLGGLKKLQVFLEANRFPVPIIKTDVYKTGASWGLQWSPGAGAVISLEEYIRTHGKMYLADDICLTSEDNSRLLLFSTSVESGCRLLEREAHIVFLCRGSSEFCQFIESSDVVYNLARFGKTKVNIFDRLAFFCNPKRYSKKVFT